MGQKVTVVAASSTRELGIYGVVCVRERIGASVFELYGSVSGLRDIRPVSVEVAVTGSSCQRVGRLAERGDVGDAAAISLAVCCSGGRISRNNAYSDGYGLIVSILHTCSTGIVSSHQTGICSKLCSGWNDAHHVADVVEVLSA